MAILIHPKRRPQMPYGASIDWGHPLAQALEVCCVFGSGAAVGGAPVELVFQSLATVDPAGSIVTVRSPYGPALNCGGVGPGANLNSGKSWDSGWQGLTLFGIFATSTTATQTIINKAVAAGSNAWWLRVQNSPLILQSSVYTVGSAAGILGGTTVSDGKYHDGCVTYNGAAINLYLDGRIDAAPVALGGGNIATQVSPVTIGYVPPPAGYFFWFNGPIPCAYAWRRPLGYSEIEWLHAEPFAMLSPNQPVRAYWPSPAAPVTTTVPNVTPILGGGQSPIGASPLLVYPPIRG